MLKNSYGRLFLRGGSTNRYLGQGLLFIINIILTVRNGIMWRVPPSRPLSAGRPSPLHAPSFTATRAAVTVGADQTAFLRCRVTRLGDRVVRHD